ncbi:MAG: Hsp20 family protein [Armatimonadetes bacterium]|nr:Hsp20 family protein [Armatimonadota bacterium]NIM24231.1 Hsp20 family protein [Armatimonadota bacterium]NIM68100.1 Hsp20 family protein [Armatimonadota bacterium]NIM76562.1 Hsp20 family protein [Armatimonadota bacterium]NIN06305.1 Hsp20 family protein [Armatimonadota bacterium]
MNLMHWDPFGDLRTLRERVDRLFEESLARSPHQEPVTIHAWSPVVDIYEVPDALVVEAELTGMKQEDVDIELTGDTLTIKGERQPSPEREFLRQERSYGAFQRAFTLGVPVDQTKVKARYRDGLLEITLPKAKQARPKQVKIEVG